MAKDCCSTLIDAVLTAATDVHRALGAGLLDSVYERALFQEIKPVNRIDPVHVSQLVTYLKLSDLDVGFILNSNSRLLKDRIKRVRNFSAPDEPRAPRGDF